MAEGHCNCKSVKVAIPALPKQSIVCYCANCKRAGSSAFSIVYFFEKTDVDIKDPHNVLKSYLDTNTKSGNSITRQFCGNCGSPVATLLGSDSSKIIVKSGLFDQLPGPGSESFSEEKPEWLDVVKTGEEMNS